VHPGDGDVKIVGPIARLDLGGSYDPGGLEHIEFIDLGDEDVLVINEVAVARVTRDGSLSWQSVHDDLTARFVGLEGSVVWFESETDRFGFGVQRGEPRFSTSM